MIKKYILPLSVVLIFSVFAGCNQNTESTHHSSEIVHSHTFHKLKFEFEDSNCGSESTPGLRFYTNFLIPNDSSAGGKNIARFVEDFIVRNIHSNTDSAFIGQNATSNNRIKNAYEDLREAYFDFRESYPDAMGCWEIEMNGDTIFTTSKVISYGLAQYSYLGGAHPNTFTTFYLFDSETGGELNPLSFFNDTTQLLQKVESTFRRVENLSSAADLESSGYFLENGKFFLPANFTFSDKGVLIHYNPYEIAPYVKGPISFTIPYHELKGNLKEELLF